jgi:hypothetical protein
MARETSKAGSATSTGEVVLTGNADRLDSALLTTEKRVGLVTQKISALAAEQGKTESAYARFDAAVAKANSGMTKAVAGTGALTNTYQRLGFAAHQLVAGTASFNQALQGVLGTLGPYGVAAGAAAGVIWHLVESHKAAAEAAKKHAEETRKAAEAERAAATSAYVTKLNARLQDDARIEAENRDFAAKRDFDDRRRELEVDIAAAEAFHQRADDIRSDLRDLQADEIERTEGFAARQEFLHQEELNRIAEDGRAEDDRHQKKAKNQSDELTADELAFKRETERLRYREQLFADMSKRVAGYIKRDREAQFDALDAEFERAMKQYQQISEFRPKAALASQLSDIEKQKATGQIDNTEAIEAERQARLAYLEDTRSATETTFEAEQRLEQARQINHDAEMARIDEEKRKRDEQIGTFTRYATSTVQSLVSIGDARHQAVRAAKLQGKTDAEAARAGKIAALEQAAGSLRALRDFAIVKAISETAAGLGALGITWGVPNPAALMHFASAAAWGVVAGGTALGARGLEGRADALQGSGDQGRGIGGAGLGQGGAANGGGASLPRGSDSPVPGSPAPRTQAGAPRAGHNFSGATFNFYGAGGKKEFMREIDEGLDDLAANRRRKSA